MVMMVHSNHGQLPSGGVLGWRAYTHTPSQVGLAGWVHSMHFLDPVASLAATAVAPLALAGSFPMAAAPPAAARQLHLPFIIAGCVHNRWW